MTPNAPGQVRTQLTRFFSQTLDIPEDKSKPDATLKNLRLDSLAVVKFLFQAEDQWGVKITDQAVPPRTFGEMIGRIAPLM